MFFFLEQEFIKMEKLPAIFSGFNGLSFIFLSLGLLFILNKKETLHKLSMGGALLSSTVFLALYLFYHYNAEPRRFDGTGFIRYLYFTILITHTVLAVAILPFILKMVYHALKDQREKHKKLARKVFPFWAYVSVTGVVVYFMLWH